MRRIILFFLYAGLFQLAMAQDLLTSARSASLSYSYPLDESTFVQLHKKGYQSLPASFFDSEAIKLPTEAFSPEKLPYGAFLNVQIQSNQLEYQLISRTHLSLYLLNNERDLSFILMDSLENVISNAQVFLGKRQIAFDSSSQSYLWPDGKQKGLLKVIHEEHVDLHYLDRERLSSWLGRNKYKLFYNRPLYILYCAPVDLYRSIRYQYSIGWVRKVTRPIYTLRQIQRHKNTLPSSNYCVTHQPVYRMGDTLRFKAFIQNSNRKAFTKPLQVQLYTWPHMDTMVQLIEPLYPGCYVYKLALTPELGCKLDQEVNLILRTTKKEKRVISTSFQLEEYELNGTQFTLRADAAYGLIAQAMDENGFNLPGASLELWVFPGKIDSIYSDRLFIRDSLWYHQQILDPIGETLIGLPASIFQDAKMNYRIEAKLQTADKYVIQREIILEDFDRKKHMKAESPSSQISATGYREKDSVFFAISNPQGLPLRYSLFCQDKIILRGGDHQPSVKLAASGRKPYFLSYQYVWKGTAYSHDNSLIYNPSPLQIQFVHPPKIYPGQEVEIEISAKDAQGQALEGVDLTAYGLTSKFEGYQPPQLPPKQAVFKNRYASGSFDAELPSPKTYSLPINLWREKADLDSIAWYQFIFPGDQLFRYEIDAPDSITQLAPFAFQDGEFMTLRYFSIDGVPAYIQATNSAKPYAVQVDPGFHSIYLRTMFHSIRIDSVWVPKGKKLILSVDRASLARQVHIQAQPYQLEDWEANMLSSYLMAFRYNGNLKDPDEMVFIQQGQRIFLPESQDNYRYKRYQTQYLIGPMLQGDFQWEKAGDYKLKTEFEQGYQYEFSPQLVKMKEEDLMELLHKRQQLSFLRNAPKINDFALTKTQLLIDWSQASIQHFQEKLDESYLQKRENTLAHLSLQHAVPLAEIERMLLFSTDHPPFFRMLEPASSISRKLKAGCYSLWILLKDSSYYRFDELSCHAFDKQFYRLSPEKPHAPDSLSRFLFQQTNPIGWLNRDSNVLYQKLEEVYRNKLQLPVYPAKDGQDESHAILIKGRVLSKKDAEPLVGARVCVLHLEEENGGVYTDKSGEYSLSVMPNDRIIISYVTYENDTFRVKSGSKVEFHESFLSNSPHIIEVTVESRLAMSANSLRLTPWGRAPIRGFKSMAAGVSLNRNTGGMPMANIEKVEINLDESIRIRGISSVTSSDMLYVVDGVPMTASELPEKYKNPDFIASITSLKGDAATALYGARASNGVIILISHDGELKRKEERLLALDEARLHQDAAHALRRNFRDYAFWQPALTTDAMGKAHFSTTFPDDVTRWNTYVLATKGRHSAQSQGSIRAYKDVMAQLSVPRFLRQGDSCQVIGKLQNFQHDSLEVSAEFFYEEQSQDHKSLTLSSSHLDTFWVSSSATDSLSLRYQLQKADGYADGEVRKIPLFARGVIEKKGHFMALHGDSSLQLSFDPALGPLHVRAYHTPMELILDELESIRSYPYSCMEQTASRLKALLAERRIRAQLGQKFAYEKQIQKMIERLEQHQHSSGFWGWWPDGKPNIWISVHVMEGLLEAAKADYDIRIDADILLANIQQRMQDASTTEQLQLMSLLRSMEMPQAYQKPLTILAKDSSLSLAQYVQFLRLQQASGLKIELDSLMKMAKRSLWGNVYWGEKSQHLHTSDLAISLEVYRLLEAIDPGNPLLSEIQAYFLERRASGAWPNTYLSIRIVESLLPAWLNAAQHDFRPNLQLQDSLIRQFPAILQLEGRGETGEERLKVEKTGVETVYLSIFQTYQNPEPEAVEGAFVLKTHAEEQSDTVTFMTAGKAVKWVVSLETKSAADYIMLEIPIPAGCSYLNKPPARWQEGEAYREYQRDRVLVFYEHLPEGKREISIELLPRFRGSYQLNPAKVEQMYFPIFYGREGQKCMKIK